MRKALIGFLIFIIIAIGVAYVLSLLKSTKDSEPTGVSLPFPEPSVSVHQKHKQFPPQIALVLDDWGYSMKNLPLLFSIEAPLTVAILPHTPYAEETARKADARGVEIILHIPLEPHKENIRLEKETIMCGMGREEVAGILETSLKKVPGAIGVSSHMGSKATEDKALMGFLLKEIKQRNLFFLDSLTTPHSVCRDVAQEVGVRFIRRNGLFLDIQYRERKDIHKRLIALAKIALKHKQAVGIGHAKRETLEVIKETLPELKEMGVRLVHLSKIIK